MKKPCAFLDRDGVINVDHDYVHLPEQLEFIPTAPEAIRWLNENGYLVVVVTNQSGIARGKFTQEQFYRFTEYLDERLAEHGAHIDATYHCPYHPDGIVPEFTMESQLRKPAPGMLLKAMAEHPIEVRGSFLIGDNVRDVSAAERAGIPGYLFLEGELRPFVESIAARVGR
ncbi:MAG: HAD family hydrolase [Armatimonadetes bacterium]|nr:HAD family hydrolase [Armatimonadota bacterium]